MPRGEGVIKILDGQTLLRELGENQVQLSDLEQISQIFSITRREKEKLMAKLRNVQGTEQQIHDTKKNLINAFIKFKLDQLDQGEDARTIEFNNLTNLVNEQNTIIQSIRHDQNLASQRDKIEVLDDGLGVLVVVLKAIGGQDVDLRNPQQFISVFNANRDQLHQSMQIVGDKYVEIMRSGTQELRRYLDGTVESAYRGTPSNYDGSRWGFVKRQYEDNPGYAWTLTLLGSIGLFMGVKKAFFGKKEGSSGGGSGGSENSTFKNVLKRGISASLFLGLGTLVAKNDTVRQKIKEITGYDMDEGAFGKFITHPIRGSIALIWGTNTVNDSSRKDASWRTEVSNMINRQNLTINPTDQALFSTRSWQWVFDWKFIQAGKMRPCTITQKLLEEIGPIEARKFLNDRWARDFLIVLKSILGVEGIYETVYMMQYLKLREEQKFPPGGCWSPPLSSFQCTPDKKIINMSGTVEEVLDRIIKFEEEYKYSQGREYNIDQGRAIGREPV